jgi:hypothetical protein
MCLKAMHPRLSCSSGPIVAATMACCRCVRMHGRMSDVRITRVTFGEHLRWTLDGTRLQRLSAAPCVQPPPAASSQQPAGRRQQAETRASRGSQAAREKASSTCRYLRVARSRSAIKGCSAGWGHHAISAAPHSKREESRLATPRQRGGTVMGQRQQGWVNGSMGQRDPQRVRARAAA